MAIKKIACSKCGRICDYEFSDHCNLGKLQWYASLRCLNCGNAVEIDGDGGLPDDLRQLVLIQDGRWRAYLGGPGVASVEFRLALRRVFDLSLREAIARARGFPGVLAVGTKSEAECLARQIGDALEPYPELSLKISIERID